jgi:hypothetical protein
LDSGSGSKARRRASRNSRRAAEAHYVLITNNATDFRPLLGRAEVHAGLVCINMAAALMSLEVQRRLFALSLDRLGNREPINELLEITLEERKVVHVERYDFPATK